jgi:hypothetical protein
MDYGHHQAEAQQGPHAMPAAPLAQTPSSGGDMGKCARAPAVT